MYPNTGGMYPNIGGMYPNSGGMYPNIGGIFPIPANRTVERVKPDFSRKNAEKGELRLLDT
jgi:hypothetical protein